MAVTIQGIQGILEAGTYTPSLTNTSNVSSSTAFQCQYMRVGNVVTVSGRVAIDPTLAAPTDTILDMTLPIASNFSANQNLGGVFATRSINQVGSIFAETGSFKASFCFNATNVAVETYFFSFTYLII